MKLKIKSENFKFWLKCSNKIDHIQSMEIMCFYNVQEVTRVSGNFGFTIAEVVNLNLNCISIKSNIFLQTPVHFKY